MAVDRLLTVVLWTLIIAIVSIHCHSHSSEFPAYKYAQQVNENDAKRFRSMNDSSSSNILISVLLSTVSINAIPILTCPMTIVRRYPSRLKILLSFASGNFLADVFLRSIPHAIASHSNLHYLQEAEHVHHSHDTGTGLFVLLGIFLLFLIEKSIRFVRSPAQTTNPLNVIFYLYLLAEFLRNYSNGLSPSFIPLFGSTFGFDSKMTAIIFELLHAFCSYAVLIHSGCTLQKALRLLLLTGMFNIVGCVTRFWLQSSDVAEQWSNQICSPITAGTFVYLITVHIVPEVMINNGGRKDTLFKVSAFVSGVLIIFWLANYQSTPFILQ